MTGFALNIDKEVQCICITVFHSMTIHIKDASERCRKGSGPNMEDVRGKHVLPASKY